MQPVYTFNLHHPVIAGCVTLGYYDGTHPSLTAATATDKIFIHSPHKKLSGSSGRICSSDASKEVVMLNLNQTITTIQTGQIDPSSDRDFLVVGSPRSILVYDVEKNMDVFYKEVPEGVKVISIGRLGKMEKPVILAGGNCTIVGFDFEGNEVFWTITGDIVCSLALMDFDSDNRNELIVGSTDYDIRVFKEDKIVGELTETEAVTSLTPLQKSCFGYGLSNGTIGVYEKLQRLWRIKSKNKAVMVFNYDIDGDGLDELIIGWSNGKVDGRSSRTGEVVFKDNFTSAVAGIVAGDYRLIGTRDLICCSVTGEVRGYEANRMLRAPGRRVNYGHDAVREMFSKKQHLMLELSNYKESTNQPVEVAKSKIPMQTKLQTVISLNDTDLKKPRIDVNLFTNNDTVIRAVLVFCEGIFQGESHVLHPKDDELTSNVTVPITPVNNVPVDLHIKALIGHKGSSNFHLFELSRQLPRFAMLQLLKGKQEKPKSFSTFVIKERIQRIILWVNQNFLLQSEMTLAGLDMELYFKALQVNQVVAFCVGSDNKITIYCDDMGLVGEITQSLAHFLNVHDLEARAQFPKIQENLKELMTKMVELNDVRLQLSTDMASCLDTIRSHVIRIEDARIIEDVEGVSKWTSSLSACNNDILKSYKVRNQNHSDLMQCLKQINKYIEQASKLRVGKPQSRLVGLCRAAVKNNNVVSLLRIINSGNN
ncbi:Bardet-Biedl syndrome 2 protein homolog [Neocloeon triangulifer]|uniref:Bardet-Biedl syndrome 2 protein homolog n=1 Tax=Neocloeon triangulifer TaxID=2078957 RepID=UPI00286F34B0|nr:Bardet-Biedl syndrome 2 protein homolog [Neocloeon triangulifer]